MSNKKQEFGDVVKNQDLIKRTLMVSAFPALIKETTKDGKTLFDGFLPGFEFSQVNEVFDEEECVELLQDMLDDEVEELVVFGKPLPNIEEDEKLIEKHKGYNVVYLDINVYATPEEIEELDGCSHDCSCCSHNCSDEHQSDEYCEDEECDCEDEECDCEDEVCDCEDDVCDCGCEEKVSCTCETTLNKKPIKNLKTKKKN